jgi:CPA1 family monovalent cation:H+ antiporter
MRGVATVALALAIPMTVDGGGAFPARERILFIAFSVVLVTLVLQGMTLPALVRLLGVRAGALDTDRAEAELIGRAARAAAEALNQMQDSEEFSVEVWDRLNAFPTDLLVRLSPHLAETGGHDLAGPHSAGRQQFRHGLQEMLAAARAELLVARSERGVQPHLVDHLVRRLDLYSMPG